MSLITDLLSRVRQPDPKRDIPPILRDSVLEETARRKAGKRLLIPVIVLFGVVLGFGAISLWESFLTPRTVSRITEHTTPEVQHIRQLAVPLPPQSRSEVAQPAQSPAGPQAVYTAVERKPKSKPVRPTREKSVTKSSEQDAIQDKYLYLYMARTFEMEKNYHLALSNYKKVIVIEPDNYVVMNNISCTLIRLGSYEEAIEYAKRALSLRRDYTPSLTNLGAAYGQLGKYHESEGYLLKALSMEPKNRVILLNLGLIYEKMGALDKAGKYFVSLSETGEVEGHMGLARIAEKQGRTADAVSFYKTAMSFDNAGSQAWNFANERLLQLTR